MSSSEEFQALLYEKLSGDEAIMELANYVFDNVDADPFGCKTAYLSFGPVDVVEDDAECIAGVRITQQIDVWSKAEGAWEAKRLTDMVRRLVHRKSWAMAENALVGTHVALTRVFPDPAAGVTHGVVQVTGIVEESS